MGKGISIRPGAGVQFFEHFGPAFTSGLSTYANLMSVLAQREFTQQLQTSTRLTELATTESKLQSDVDKLQDKVNTTYDPDSEATLNNARQNLEIVRSQKNALIHSSITNTGLNSGLGGSFMQKNPGFFANFKQSFNQAKGTTPRIPSPQTINPQTTSPTSGTQDLTGQTSTGETAGVSTSAPGEPQSPASQQVQEGVFAQLGVTPFPVNSFQEGLLRKHFDTIKTFGNQTIRDSVAKSAIQSLSEKDFTTEVQKYQPAPSDQFLQKFPLIQQAKSAIDDITKIYEKAPNAVGPLQSLGPALVGVSNVKEFEARAKIDNIRNRYLSAARNLISNAGANLTENEKQALYADFPNPTNDSQTFSRQIADFKNLVGDPQKGIFNINLAAARATGKDYGQFEKLDINSDLGTITPESLQWIDNLPSVFRSSRSDAKKNVQSTGEPTTQTTKEPQVKVKGQVEFDGRVFDSKEGVFKNKDFQATSDNPAEAPPGTYAPLPKEANTSSGSPKPKRYRAIDSFKQMILQDPQTFLNTVKNKNLSSAAKSEILKAIQELRKEGHRVEIK